MCKRVVCKCKRCGQQHRVLLHDKIASLAYTSKQLPKNQTTSSSLCGTIAEERQHLLIIDCSSSHVMLDSIYLALHVVSLVVLLCYVLTCTLPLRYCTHEFISHGTLAPTFRTLPRWAGVGDVKSSVSYSTWALENYLEVCSASSCYIPAWSPYNKINNI